MSTSGETPDTVPVERVDEVRADIAETRAELGDTLDHLVAKLDVKSRARHQLDEVTSAARDKVGQARQAAPEPVQHALDRAAVALGPAAQRARPYRKQIALIVAGVLLVTVIVRRLGRD